MGLQCEGSPLHLADQRMRVKRGPVSEQAEISALGFCVQVVLVLLWLGGTFKPLLGR